MATSILCVIQHYQRSIEHSQDDESRLLHCINKLYKLPVKVEHLQETGIGKTVNSLRKYNGEIGVAAKALVTKWKAMVAAEEEPMDTQCQTNDAAPTPASGRDSSDDDNSQHQHHNNSTHVRSNSNNSSSHTHRSSDKEKHHKDRKSRKEGESSSSNERHSSKSRHHRSHSRHQSTEKQHKNRDQEEKSEQNEHHRQRHNNESSKEKEKHKSRSEKDKKEVVTARESEHKSSSDRNGAVKEKEKEREKRHRSKERHHSQKNGVHEVREKSHKDVGSEKHSSSKERERHGSDKPKDHKLSAQSSSNEREKHREKEREHRSKHKSSSQSRSSNAKPSTSSNAAAATTPTSTSTTSAQHITAKSDYKRSYNAVDSDHDEPVSITKKAKIENRSKHKDLEVDGVGDVEPEDGIDSSMGANFADVLGMLNMPSKKTKKSSNALKSPNASVAKTIISTSTSSTSKKSGDSTKSDNVKSVKTTSTSSSTSASTSASNKRSPPDEKPALLTSAAKLEPLDPSIVLDLPAISLHYKPLPVNQTVMDCVYQNFPTTMTTPKQSVRTLTDAEAISHGISSKTMRTKIYSGVKTGQIHQVPSLFDLCIRVLQKNIDALEYTGGVPFEVLRPVLERATPQQLLNFEDYNPYLMEDSDVLWQLHVQRSYRNKKREEMESWREMYLRCQEEEQQKLNTITQTIRQSQKIIAAPVRKTQLAFVDSMVKPPRNVQRKQEQYGTKSKLIATPASRVAALSSVTPNAAKTGDVRLRVAANVRDAAQVSHAPVRPKKAPLMAKTLQFMRGRHKR